MGVGGGYGWIFWCVVCVVCGVGNVELWDRGWGGCWLCGVVLDLVMVG